MFECPNLMQRFGKRFKITFDPCYDPKHRPKDKLDPWMMHLPCELGVIYPFDETRLCVELMGHGVTAVKLDKLDCCELYQDGDTERSFLFLVEAFEEVAAIVKPRKRRRLPEEQRQKCAEHLANLRSQNPAPRLGIEARINASTSG